MERKGEGRKRIKKERNRLLSQYKVYDNHHNNEEVIKCNENIAVRETENKRKRKKESTIEREQERKNKRRKES